MASGRCRVHFSEPPAHLYTRDFWLPLLPRPLRPRDPIIIDEDDDNDVMEDHPRAHHDSETAVAGPSSTTPGASTSNNTSVNAGQMTSQHSNIPPPLPPSVEAAYKRKCIELRRRIKEIEAENDKARVRKIQLRREVDKQRLLRAILLEKLDQVLGGINMEEFLTTLGEMGPSVAARMLGFSRDAAPTAAAASAAGAARDESAMEGVVNGDGTEVDMEGGEEEQDDAGMNGDAHGDGEESAPAGPSRYNGDDATEDESS